MSVHVRSWRVASSVSVGRQERAGGSWQERVTEACEGESVDESGGESDTIGERRRGVDESRTRVQGSESAPSG